MANVYKGVGVSWGVGSTASSAFGTYKLQSRDHELKTEMERIKDASGISVGTIYFDQSEEATFEYIATGASGGANTPTLPAIGDIITVTDTTAYTSIAGTTWVVESVSTKGSNTSAVKVTVKVTKFPSITS